MGEAGEVMDDTMIEGSAPQSAQEGLSGGGSRQVSPDQIEMTGSGAAPIWRSLAAGLCGSAAHSGLILRKSWIGWLPSFHPYEDI